MLKILIQIHQILKLVEKIIHIFFINNNNINNNNYSTLHQILQWNVNLMSLLNIQFYS